MEKINFIQKNRLSFDVVSIYGIRLGGVGFTGSDNKKYEGDFFPDKTANFITQTQLSEIVSFIEKKTAELIAENIELAKTPLDKFLEAFEAWSKLKTSECELLNTWHLYKESKLEKI